jgi:hypothetical protein
MVGLGRLELPTSPLSGVRSSHLSYRPGANPDQKLKSRTEVERACRLRRHGRSCRNARKERSESGSRALPQVEEARGVGINIVLANRRSGAAKRGSAERDATFSLRKEVIQPQVLLQLPCYDFTPIMSHTLGGCLPCGLAHRLLVSPTFVM